MIEEDIARHIEDAVGVIELGLGNMCMQGKGWKYMVLAEKLKQLAIAHAFTNGILQFSQLWWYQLMKWG